MMTKKRLFYVVYLADPFVQSCLDLIRYLAEWSEKTPAHITVRGPYDRRLPAKIEQEIDATMRGAKVDVLGVSAFLNQHQNTIYLRCSAPELSHVWYKPNYPFNPHLTLYDGDDRAFADDLLAGLNSVAGQFPMTARGVDYIVSIKGERVLPTTRLSIDLACKELKINIEKDASKHNLRDVRLSQIFRVYQALQNYCGKLNNSTYITDYDVVRTYQGRRCETSAVQTPYHVVGRRKSIFLRNAPKV